MYQISYRLSTALNCPDEAFGGMNMIFAGDFAQLPPVGGESLFAPEQNVSSIRRGKMSVADQENSIGKFIWKQVTTVVMLKKNMRMAELTADDVRFRTALMNMRYGACTANDIAFLRTRIASNKAGRPNFKNPKFRDVSVITAWNSQKDKINEMGVKKFAAERNLSLTHFYSDDTLVEYNPNSDRAKKATRGKLKFPARRDISDAVQEDLWNSPPCMSDHFAGKLSLCIGLPVIIRHNEATELCITKGQEGTVCGWREDIGSRGQRVLDTLFVELTDPPRPIQVPGLPTNVVPLAKGNRKVWCSLTNDMMIHISRDQVQILPNFSMTDYSSQGKTRIVNIVDLNNSKNFHSYYTALSRGSSAAETMILQGWNPSILCGGISGWLRQ
ncbi:hypothetical protein C8R43DRAFT_883718, partial [Mycena crocata]